MTQGRRIAVLGAGFSGSLVAVHLLRRCRPQDRIHLVERNDSFGRGLAYSTGNPRHLLNVRIENMSAFPDDPTHFARWLAGQPPEKVEAESVGGEAGTFVARRLYGAYIQALLGDEIWTGGRGRNLFLVPDEAVALRRERDGALLLEMAGGRPYRLDAVVLALGNFAPEGGIPGHAADPWDPAATLGIPPEAPVLLVGTGLTMVDTIVSLGDAGHRGPVVAISRRGLLPHPHRAVGRRPPLSLAGLPLSRALAAVRADAALAEAGGGDWRSVVDALRPDTASLWRALPEEAQRRFLRHLRPWWDIHRHRLAPPVRRIIEREIAGGRLVLEAGSMVSMEPIANGIKVATRARGAQATTTRDFARVINCSGPADDYQRLSHPLVRSLFEGGLVRPDPLRLGLDARPDGALVDAAGRAAGDLYAVGPVTKGCLWEITAVPDIRLQCARVAAALMDEAQAAAVA